VLLISDTDYDDDEDDDDNADGDGNDIIGVKIVVGGLHVESTSVYWVACPSVCRHAVLLQSVTDTDKSYVASSLPFDGTGRHTIRHVLVVAAHSGTLVRLELPPSGTATVWNCRRLLLTTAGRCQEADTSIWMRSSPSQLNRTSQISPD